MVVDKSGHRPEKISQNTRLGNDESKFANWLALTREIRKFTIKPAWERGMDSISRLVFAKTAMKKIFRLNLLAVSLLMLAQTNVTWSTSLLTAQEESFDYVWVRDDDARDNDPGNSTRHRGTIVDFNAERLALQVRDRQREFPADQVLRFETPYTQQHLQALELLKQNKSNEALQILDEALSEEPRIWVKREIVALQLRALQDSDNYHQVAGPLFERLVNQEPNHRFYHWAPLRWPGSARASADESSLALEFLQDSNPGVKLVGASWLLGGSSRDQAIEALGEISQDPNPHLAHLASAQLWQTKLLVAKESDVERWQLQLGKMPRELKAGPQLTIGMARARLANGKETVEEAAAELMRVPILYQDQILLASQALNESSRLLQRNQRSGEARTIALELLTRYPRTPAGRDGKIQQIINQSNNQ